MVFGEALLAGKGRMVMLGFAGIAAVTVGGHLLRGHLAREKALLVTAEIGS